MTKCYIYILMMLLISPLLSMSYAQNPPQNMGLVVSPAVLDVNLDKGKVYTRELLVKNTSSSPTGFVVRIENLALSDFASVSEEEIVPPDWINPDQQEFILNSGEVRKLSIVFSPSLKTPPGGYYGVLYIQPVADISSLARERTTSVPKVGVLLLAKVNGKAIQNTVFTGFNYKSITTNRDSITLGFENLGNVHSMPSGEVLVTNLLSKKQHRLLLPPSIIFPNSSKDIKLKFNSTISQGLYEIEYTNNPKKNTAIVFFVSYAGVLATAFLTFLIIILTLYIRNYFMSKKTWGKIIEK